MGCAGKVPLSVKKRCPPSESSDFFTLYCVLLSLPPTTVKKSSLSALHGSSKELSSRDARMDFAMRTTLRDTIPVRFSLILPAKVAILCIPQA